MAGTAIVIGLQQLKSLLGIGHFTTKTDVVSVLEAVWYPLNFVLGCLFLIFILITRFIGKKNKKLFWLPAISLVISVIISTLIVYLTRANEHGLLLTMESSSSSSYSVCPINSKAKVGSEEGEM
ncbi:putative SLC26A/SulP transporter [Helianthus annuus]|nr:putative SLC26A/SulP transporter [Helianthus annuus]